jgi:hypothetical protein
MMVKIISGGQTGADQGALDAAIKVGVSHGGWIPKGRKTEDGRLPENYCLKETSSSHYSQRTKRNVMEADGTLIVSHGELSGGSAYCRAIADKHSKPWLHIDLNRTASFLAAFSIKKWIIKYEIRVLNVAGTRASKDPSIYNAVFTLIETVYYLLQTDKKMSGHAAENNFPSSHMEDWPQTVDDAVDLLIKRISLKDKTYIANMLESELGALEHTLGRYVQDHFGLWGENHTLINDCRKDGGMVAKEPGSTVSIIIKSLWTQLRKTHRLRVVK